MDKSTLLKLIVLAVSGLVFIYAAIGCAVITHAEEITTVTISGDDLYALLVTGTWEAYYTVNGTEYQYTNVGSSNNGDYVVMKAFSQTGVNGGNSLTNVNAQFNTGISYNNVVGIDIVLSSGLEYTVAYQGGTNFSFVPFIYADGYVVGNTGNVLLPQAMPNVSNGSLSYTGELGTTTNFNYALLTADFEAMTTSNILFETVYETTQLTGSINVTPLYYYTFVKEITFTILDNTGGNTGGDTGGDDNTGDDSDDTGSGSGGSGGSASETEKAILNQIEEANKKLEELTTSTEEDKAALDELQQDMQEVQDKADEYNEVMDSVETPRPQDVLPDDTISDILENEDVAEGQPYIFSILESLQSITWLLTMILISVTVGIIKYIIYGKS